MDISAVPQSAAHTCTHFEIPVLSMVAENKIPPCSKQNKDNSIRQYENTPM